MKMHASVRWLVFAVIMMSLSAVSFAQIAVGISVRVAPPALPVYTQPVGPGPGYLWTPGYWAWNDDGGYYWVPGTWVVAPVGLLWTPGYWGFSSGVYGWHRGYWGPHIGFYGGVNYGFGYGGVGFAGGEWRGHSFYYNRAVTHVTNVTNVYNKTVIVNQNHVAFNGGQGGIPARPTREEEIAEHEHHTAPLAAQTRHEHLASQNKQNFASTNHGRPAIAATVKPGVFSGRGVVAAKSAGAPYKAPAMSLKQARSTSTTASKQVSTSVSTNNRGKSTGHMSTPSNTNTTASKKPNNSPQDKGSSNESRHTPHSNETHAASPHPPSQPHESAPKSSPALKPVAQHQSAPKPAPQEHSAPRPGKERR